MSRVANVIILRVNRRHLVIFGAGMLFLCLLSALAYNLPPIHDRLAWRVDNLRVRVRRLFNPPEEAVFVPQAPGTNIAPTAAAPLATAPRGPVRQPPL